MKQNDSDNLPLVTPKFYGQLGNQLFIIAATLSYAWDYNAKPIFPGLNTEENRTSYNRDRLFFRLDTTLSPRTFRNIFRERFWYSSDRIPFRTDLILDGYFQSWKHFNHHRSNLLSIFDPSSNTLNVLNEKYKKLIASQKTVSIHVRTAGKYNHDQRFHPFLGLKYYQNAINQFPNDSVFVVFSDRINWCKKHFPALERSFIFIEDNDGIEDLFLMSMMRNHIIANSTFSWWGAYLNRNPNQRVIAPEFWGGCPQPPQHPLKELILPEWTILPVPPFEPYPADIYDYGESQSCYKLE